MNNRDMTKNSSKIMPQRKPKLVDQIDAVLDRNFAALVPALETMPSCIMSFHQIRGTSDATSY